MLVWRQAGRQGGRAAVAIELAGLALLAVGCASPGPPRAPSLQLPETVTDLQATRRAGPRGGVVELEFAVPSRTTDGMAYRGKTIHARVCRAVDMGSCLPVASLTDVPLAVGAADGTGGVGSGGVASGKAAGAKGTGAKGAAASAAGVEPKATLEDVLPASLLSGPTRLLTYRVELSNEKGRTAGFGDAAYAAAGVSPGPVAGLRAGGSRQGVAVRWQPAAGANPGDVVLRRELVSGSGGSEGEVVKGKADGGQASRPGRAKAAGGATRGEPGVVWLSTAPERDPLGPLGAPGASGERGGSARPDHAEAAAKPANGVLDDEAAVGSTYRYAAERQETVQLGGHTVVLHGELSAPVEVTLRAVYPPPAPTDLVGTVFPLAPGDLAGNVAGGGLAADLIWTPADDPGTAGYKVFREVLEAGGAVLGDRTLLTAQPVRVPAFHDVLPAAIARGAGTQANGSRRLRYSVVAVDSKGMESVPVVTVLGLRGR